jgi:hypothetical protein
MDRMTTKLRVRFDGTTLVPLGPVDLPTDSELDVTVNDSTPPSAASPSVQRILDAIWALPPLEAETARMFLDNLTSGKIVGKAGGIFDHLIDS